MTPTETAADLSGVHLTAADIDYLNRQNGGQSMDEGERTNVVAGMADEGDVDVINRSKDVKRAADKLDNYTAEMEELLADNGYMSAYEVNQGQEIRREAAHARQTISEALETLKAIMRDYDTPAGIKVDAARALIDGAVQLDTVRIESETAAIGRHYKASRDEAAGRPGPYSTKWNLDK